ncbi:MAG: nucleotidyl transferase AbiEii/AbiGii toxin family protein [Candidatus Delongbacteria bacterium]|nr:nucleotidyl transferase AbiEii/AbiGii toxin family protein [Candidatus Delongbacteria bacterium]
MIDNKSYLKQSELLIDVLPFLYKENDFALKGGTAINFFIRNMPRLSIDIDIVYLSINERVKALNEISDMLERLSFSLKKSNPLFKTELKKNNSLNLKLFVVSENVIVKIEPNTTLRGSVFPSQHLSLCEKAKNKFKKDVIVYSLSTPDIYGGKICAALDRQHPRDLFDIKLLMENESITESIRKAFIVYLLSHPRPVLEMLNPNFHDIKAVFDKEFVGMTDEDISCEELIKTRENLLAVIQKNVTDKEKEFLISFKSGYPRWDLFEPYEEYDPVFNIDRIISLPSIKWKLLNIQKMDKRKHQTALNDLEKFLNGI